jgi:hypothetical protein
MGVHYATDRVDPFYMGFLERLRDRTWFWPPALWLGLKWLFALGSHPMVRLIEIFVAFSPLFGVAIVIRFHLDSFFAVLFATIFFLAVWAKGARLKWLSDRAEVSRGENPDFRLAPMQLPPGAQEIREIESGRTIVRPLTDKEADDFRD